MTVLSVSIPSRRSGVLAAQALMYGVETTQVETEGDTIYVDLTGRPEKSLRAAVKAGATILDAITYTEAPGIKSGFGQDGEGVMIDDSHKRLATYGRLMAMAR